MIERNFFVLKVVEKDGHTILETINGPIFGVWSKEKKTYKEIYNCIKNKTTLDVENILLIKFPAFEFYDAKLLSLTIDGRENKLILKDEDCIFTFDIAPRKLSF